MGCLLVFQKGRGGSDVENGLVNAKRLSRVIPRSFPNNPRAQALVRFGG